MFDRSFFIKADDFPPEPYGGNSYAPIFKKSFFCENSGNYILNVCALGIGYVYINGAPVSEDIFCAPVSDYRKTLWYNSYDVTSLINKGENVMTVFCGNGFYNENFKSAWDFDKVSWRDVPKFIAEIKCNDRVVLASDDKWRVCKNSFITFNQFRSGERFDARLFSSDFAFFPFDERFPFAVIDKNYPRGEFLPFSAPPVRETEMIKPVKTVVLENGDVFVDFGINIAGYVGLNAMGKSGDKIVVRHAEEADENYDLLINGLDCFYEVPFQTDEIICGDAPVFYKPFFTYHGFRFARIAGIDGEIEKYDIRAYRINSIAKRIGEFSCSDGFLNKLHDCSENSVRSNLQYNLTDCPTREKLGWTNDAAMSAEHIFYIYDCFSFFRKWLKDISDTMREDGALSGIAPSPDWGYGNGPVCDIALFEIPHVAYMFTGDSSLLLSCAPFYGKYLEYLKRKEKEGHVFPLADWMGFDNSSTSKTFITEVLTTYFYKIYYDAEKNDEILHEYDLRLQKIKDKYILADGTCSDDTITAVAMCICFDIYDDIKPLKMQLVSLIEQKSYHTDFGLLGNKYVYIALDKCDLNDHAFKMIKVKGIPGYDFWLEDGATSLYENWFKRNTCSQNHHMFSAVNVFNFKVLGGIRFKKPLNNRPVIEIKPFFAEDINNVSASIATPFGKVSVKWKRQDRNIKLTITVEGTQMALYDGNILRQGESKFTV